MCIRPVTETKLDHTSNYYHKNHYNRPLWTTVVHIVNLLLIFYYLILQGQWILGFSFHFVDSFTSLNQQQQPHQNHIHKFVVALDIHFVERKGTTQHTSSWAHYIFKIINWLGCRGTLILTFLEDRFWEVLVVVVEWCCVVWGVDKLYVNDFKVHERFLSFCGLNWFMGFGGFAGVTDDGEWLLLLKKDVWQEMLWLSQKEWE